MRKKAFNLLRRKNNNGILVSSSNSAEESEPKESNILPKIEEKNDLITAISEDDNLQFSSGPQIIPQPPSEAQMQQSSPPRVQMQQSSLPGVQMQQSLPGAQIKQTFHGIQLQQPSSEVQIQHPFSGTQMQQPFPAARTQQPLSGIQMQQHFSRFQSIPPSSGIQIQQPLSGFHTEPSFSEVQTHQPPSGFDLPFLGMKNDQEPLPGVHNKPPLPGVQTELQSLRDQIKELGGINEKKIVESLKLSFEKSILGISEEKAALEKTLSDITFENMELKKKLSNEEDSVSGTSETVNSNLTEKLHIAEQKYEAAESSRAMLADQLQKLHQNPSLLKSNSLGSSTEFQQYEWHSRPTATDVTETSQYQKLEKDLSKALHDLADTEASVSVLRELLYEKDKEIEKLKNDTILAKANQEYVENAKEIENAKLRVEANINPELRAKLKLLEQNLVEAEMDLINVRSGKTRVDVALKELEETNEILNTKNIRLENHLHEANEKVDTQYATMKEMEHGFSLMLDENSSLKRNVSELERSHQSLKNDNSKYKSSMKELQKELAKRDKRYKELRSHADSLTMRIERVLNKLPSDLIQNVVLPSLTEGISNFEVAEQALITLEDIFSGFHEEKEQMQENFNKAVSQNVHLKNHCAFLVKTLKNSFLMVNNKFHKDNQPTDVKSNVSNTAELVSNVLDKLNELEQFFYDENVNNLNNNRSNNGNQQLTTSTQSFQSDLFQSPSNENKKIFSNLSEMLKEREAEIDKTKEIIREMNDELSNTRLKLEELEKTNLMLKNQNSSLTLRVQRKETAGDERINARFVELKNENTSLKEDLESSMEQITELEVVLIEKENVIKSLEKDLTDLSTALVNYDIQSKAQDKKNETLKEQVTPIQGNRAFPVPENKREVTNVRNALSGLMLKQQQALESLHDIESKMMDQLQLVQSSSYGSNKPRSFVERNSEDYLNYDLGTKGSTSVFDGLTSFESSVENPEDSLTSLEHNTVSTIESLKEFPEKNKKRYPKQHRKVVNNRIAKATGKYDLRNVSNEYSDYDLETRSSNIYSENLSTLSSQPSVLPRKHTKKVEDLAVINFWDAMGCS